MRDALVQRALPESPHFHAAGLPPFSVPARDAQSESAIGMSGRSFFTVLSALRPHFGCFGWVALAHSLLRILVIRIRVL
jgi:hypothetical protein